MLTLTRCTPRALTLSRLYSDQKSLYNQPIIDFLRRCQVDEETRPDVNSYKVTAYKHAIRSISQVQQPIRLGNDILKLPGVGSGIMTRINEFLYASESMENQHPQLQLELQKARALKMLQDIPGIGPNTAKKLVDAGCNSVEELRSPLFMSMLSEKQRTKVRYMGHIERHIEIEDVQDVLNFCRQSLDPKFELTPVGEYRRNIIPCPEINLMITHPEFVYIPLPSDPSLLSTTPRPPKTRSRRQKTAEEKQTTLLQTLILPLLQQRGLIAETLSSTQKSWQGIIRLPEQAGAWADRVDRVAGIENMEGRFRRMSINFVSHKCRGASLLALTGDSAFHKHLKSQANQCGLLLNEYGLWKWNHTPQDSPSTSISPDDNAAADGVVYDSPEKEKGYWSLVKSCTEEEIFEELGIDFIEPSKRNFAFISAQGRKKERVGPPF